MRQISFFVTKKENSVLPLWVDRLAYSYRPLRWLLSLSQQSGWHPTFLRTRCHLLVATSRVLASCSPKTPHDKYYFFYFNNINYNYNKSN